MNDQFENIGKADVNEEECGCVATDDHPVHYSVALILHVCLSVQ